jgi:hypothetical protein
MSILWKVLPPYEVRLTVEEAQRLLGAANLCRDIVAPKVLALIRDADKTVYSIRIDRMKPDQLALMLITNVVGRELGSGIHHAYRGTLSMVGNDMRSLWHKAQKLMVERG